MEKIIDGMQKNIESIQEDAKEIAKLNDDIRKEENEIGILLSSCVEQMKKIRKIIDIEVAGYEQ